MIRRFWFPIIVGLAAAALTAGLLVLGDRNPHIAPLPIISDVLAIGFVFAMIPFGGLHELALPMPIAIVVGASFNGALWFGLSAGVISIYRGIRRIRRSITGEHVT